ncbi:putative bifunctional diguanylate cyclase/phosphodiesterase [Pararhizobium sp.]|uniref:putative bifunctional diguanylate cyclase/phosphodiesterase n=1 Tax=Pararhizobium sp. TaxID=1977563 RepID=UPI00272393E1|nr:EAL domain-containing protein [Pararhizobium sp.]MDO9415234.1 EAL domain-containing protein [Pararhizobium sp.]
MAGNGRSELPTDVYLSFVSSLYHNRKTLLIGVLAHVVTFLLVWTKTADGLYLLCAGFVVLTWVIRLADMRRFDRQDFDGASLSDIKRWEDRYIARGLLVTLTCGSACGYAILVSQDAFAELALISVTLGSMMSVVGRNYGSPKAVWAMTLSACGPIVLGLLGLWDMYMAILAFLILPLAATTWIMAKGVREFLYKNVLAAREISTIADRFDTALNNMTHGLFMLDAENRILVANKRACQLLQLGDQDMLKDSYLDVVLRYGMRHAFMDSDQSRHIIKQLDEMMRGVQSRALIQFADDLFLEFSAKQRRAGGVVLIFEDVTQRIHAERKILHMVRFDSLTGLPNRDHFGDLVQTAIGSKKRTGTVGFMVLDVDEFKHVNDMKGHVTGDRLLVAIGERLGRVGGDQVITARLMGDEFLVFFPNDNNRPDIEGRLRRIHDLMGGNYDIDGSTFHVSFSAGYVLVSSAEWRLEELQIKADLALFEAKLRNKGGCMAFEPEMDERYIDRQKLKADLRAAVQAGTLSVAYQPMFRPDGTSIDCCEALSRWTHPERGAVSPAVFIRMAEEIGVVSEITRFVLNQACRDCMQWPEHVAVSVNLSILDLRNGNIIAVVMDALSRSGLAPSRLHLEVTESCLMEEMVKVQAILEELRARGVIIAIDDFGTGYSSLSYLDSLPLDIIKIDRSFVRNIREDARRFKLLRGTVNLSRELGLKIVIEGVETRDQLDLINKFQCADLIQGFVFAAPMPATAIESLCDSLEKRGRRPKAPGRLIA